MIKRKYPVHKEMMERCIATRQNVDLASKVGFFLVLESRMVLRAYYGSIPKACAVLMWQWLNGEFVSAVTRIRIGICDLAGWTVLREIPGLDPRCCKERHGRKCQCQSCDQMDCIQRSVPQWYQTVTFWNWP